MPIIEVTAEVTCTVTIKFGAANEEEAEDIAQEKVEQYLVDGTEGNVTNVEANITHVGRTNL